MLRFRFSQRMVHLDLVVLMTLEALQISLQLKCFTPLKKYKGPRNHYQPTYSTAKSNETT